MWIKREKIMVKNRTVFAKDCLDVLENSIPEKSVDLIYLDPPFNSNQHYNLPFKGEYAKDFKAVMAFEDTWTWTDKEQENLDRLKMDGGG